MWIFYIDRLLIIWKYDRIMNIETVSPEGTFCDTVQVPSGVGDMQLI